MGDLENISVQSLSSPLIFTPKVEEWGTLKNSLRNSWSYWSLDFLSELSNGTGKIEDLTKYQFKLGPHGPCVFRVKTKGR